MSTSTSHPEDNLEGNLDENLEGNLEDTVDDNLDDKLENRPEDNTVQNPADETSAGESDTTPGESSEAGGPEVVEADESSMTSDTPTEPEQGEGEPTQGQVVGEATQDEGEQDEAEQDEAEQHDGESAAGRPRSTASQDLVREGEIAADFLETLLDIADLDGDLEVDVEGDRAAVAIVDSEDGAAPRRLVGPGGEVLEALQELTRLAVQAETGDRSRLMLDVAGFRADRRAELVRTAKRAIDEVKESGERRELEPMTAFERKVVHDEVLAAGLHSESEGAEPSRFVVVLPAG